MANEVVITVRADDRAGAEVGRLSNKLGRTLRRAALLGGAAIAGIGAASVKMAADFEKAFAEVTTLFDASEQQIEALRQGTLNLSRSMGVDATEATQALYQAISAGVAPENALAFLNENVKLAIGGVTDLSTAVDLTTTVLNAFGLASSDLTNVMDTMFLAVVQGKTTIDELAASMFNVAGAAAASGVSVEETAVAIATLAAAGTPTTVATTALRAAFVELGKEGTKANLAFREIANVGFRQFQEEGGNIVEVMELLRQKAEQDGVAVGDLFSSMEAGVEIGKLAGEQFATLTSNMEGMGDKAGATQTAFEKMNETFSRQFDILKAELSVALIELGTQILPKVTSAVRFVIEAIRGFRDEATSASVEVTLAFLEMKQGFLDAALDLASLFTRDIPVIGQGVDFLLDKTSKMKEELNRTEADIARLRDQLGTLARREAFDAAIAMEATGDAIARSIQFGTQTALERLADLAEGFRVTAQNAVILATALESFRERGLSPAQMIARLSVLADQIGRVETAAGAAAGGGGTGAGPSLERLSGAADSVASSVGGAASSFDEFNRSILQMPAVPIEQLLNIARFLQALDFETVGDQLRFLQLAAENAERAVEDAAQAMEEAARIAEQELADALSTVSQETGIAVRDLEELFGLRDLAQEFEDALQHLNETTGETIGTFQLIDIAMQGLADTTQDVINVQRSLREELETIGDSIAAVARLAGVTRDELLEVLDQLGLITLPTLEDALVQLAKELGLGTFAVIDLMVALQELKQQADETFDTSRLNEYIMMLRRGEISWETFLAVRPTLSPTPDPGPVGEGPMGTTAGQVVATQNIYIDRVELTGDPREALMALGASV